jgi:hypothetical protein
MAISLRLTQVQIHVIICYMIGSFDEAPWQPTWPIFSEFEVATWQGPAAEPLDHVVHGERLQRAKELVEGWQLALNAAGVLDGEAPLKVYNGATFLLKRSVRELGHRSITQDLRPIDLLAYCANNVVGRKLYTDLQKERAKDVLEQSVREQDALERALRTVRASAFLADDAIRFAVPEDGIAS